MNRLPSELHRLYAAQAPGPDTAPEALRLIDDSGRVRAMVLSLARPADWQALAKVWQGVQVDLDLPAPAIAVSGTDAYQLWFSLAQPLPAAQALVFLESLRLRYLGDIKPQRVGLMPSMDGASPPRVQHADTVPALQASGCWSAFVAPELAAGVFAQLERAHATQTAPFEALIADYDRQLLTLEYALKATLSEELESRSRHESRQASPPAGSSNQPARPKVIWDVLVENPLESVFLFGLGFFASRVISFANRPD